MNDFADDQSVFNMGIALLIRIDKILSEIAVAKMRGDTKIWYAGVFVLKGEVYYQLKAGGLDEQKNKIKDERKEVDDLFKQVAPMITETNRRSKQGQNYQDPKLALKLEEIETKLKESLHRRGMMGAKRNDPRYALANG